MTKTQREDKNSTLSHEEPKSISFSFKILPFLSNKITQELLLPHNSHNQAIFFTASWFLNQ